MTEQPDVKVRDLITIGKSIVGTRAIVAEICPSGEIVVVYEDSEGESIGERVKWSEDSWSFARSGPCGVYAKNSTKLRPFISSLKSRLHRSQAVF